MPLIAETLKTKRERLEAAARVKEKRAQRVVRDAAPDMLAALIAVRDAENSEGRERSGGFVYHPATREHQQRVAKAWQMLHAAIAKATGEVIK